MKQRKLIETRVFLGMLSRSLGKHPQEKSPHISVSALLSSAICYTIAATSSLVAAKVFPDNVLMLPDASGSVFAWTA